MVSPVAITHVFNGDSAAANFVNAADLDTQLDNLADTMNAEIAERQRTVRDGSGLASQVVTYDSLHPQVTALLVAGGVIPKQAVATIGLSNSAIAGLLVIDGYTLLANDRVLLTAQTNTVENGIWVASSGAWARPTDATNGDTLAIYTQVGILYGSTFSGSLWILSAEATVGSTAQTWYVFSYLPGSITLNAAYVSIATPQTVTGVKIFSAVTEVSNTTEATAIGAAAHIVEGGQSVAKRSFLGVIGSTFKGNVLAGVQDGTAPVAGQMSEVISSTFTGVAAAATTVTGNVTSIVLTPGYWLIMGQMVISGGSTGLTNSTIMKHSIVTVSASDGVVGDTRLDDWVMALKTSAFISRLLPTLVVNITSNTTYYLTSAITYAGGSPTYAGKLLAQRIG